MKAALTFLTVLGGGDVPGPHALRWFGPAGLIVGAIVATAWWGASQWWSPVVAAALAVAADAMVTGMLHLDGLADCGDGLIAPMSKGRRLEVMHTPDIGAFGTVVVASTLLIRFAAFTALTPDSGTLLVVCLVWALTRAAMTLTVRVGRYAHPGGLVETFRSDSSDTPALWPDAVGIGVLAVIAGLVPVALTTATPTLAGVAAAGTALVVFALVVTFAYHRIDGYTGDVLGAAGVLAETAALLVLAIR